jgi:hypothetical protein
MLLGPDVRATRTLCALALAAAGFAAGACSSSDDGGGTTPAGTAGTGASTGGTGGGASGGDFWPSATYVSGTATPAAPDDASHYAGAMCMTCHATTALGGGYIFLFGGTVYGADGTSPASGVEVGVRYNGQVYTCYSDANGNFSVEGSAPITEGVHEARMRTATGETIKAATEVSSAECNDCHRTGGTSTPLVAP